MRFTLRLAETEDLKWCASSILDGFERNLELKNKLSRIWAELIDADAMTMVVIEDDLRRCLVAFGAGVLVSEAFFQEPDYGKAPYLAVRLLQRERGGQTPYILRPDQIREVNCPAEGINLVILHYWESTEGLNYQVARPVRDKAVGALLETQSGYSIKRIVFEFFGQQDVTYAERMGVLIRTDYHEYFRTAPFQPSPETWPYLGELTSQEATGNWGSPLSGLFSYSEPLIFFSPMQQAVLLRAARGNTDDLIAKQLDLAPATIRAHWKAIFNRVIDIQRAGAFARPILAEEGVTGQRQNLLRYLEQHPEELRPIDRRCFRKMRRSSSLKG